MNGCGCVAAHHARIVLADCRYGVAVTPQPTPIRFDRDRDGQVRLPVLLDANISMADIVRVDVDEIVALAFGLEVRSADRHPRFVGEMFARDIAMYERN